MKRVFRVKKHSEFDKIIKSGKAIRSGCLSFHYLPSTNNYTRIGIAIGKANGKAVKRVRQKRQLRAMIANCCDYSLSADIIIIIKPSFAEGEFKKTQEELRQALEQIRRSI